MKLSTPRYSCCLIFQLGFLICDLIFNCVSLFPRSRDGLLVLFVFQDLFLVLSITMMLMSFFSTYLFQAGLVQAACSRWRGALVCALHAALTLTLHAATLIAATPATATATPSSPALIALLTAQRCLSPWHYYTLKRLTLRAADPRLYEDLEWLPT